LKAAGEPYVPVEPQKAPFKPKYDLPLLHSYEGKFPDNFWHGCRKEVRLFEGIFSIQVK
jgi:hypothetical protein